MRFGQQGQLILKRHLLPVSCHKRQSLEAIAHELRITRQAVAQTMKSFLRRLHASMINNDYRGCRVFFIPGFLQPLQALNAQLGNQRVLSESDWNCVVAQAWHLQQTDLKDVEFLLLAILGFRRIEFDSDEHPQLLPIITKGRLKTGIAKLARAIKTLLLNHDKGLTVEKVAGAIRTRGHLRDVEEDLIRVVLRSMPDVQISDLLYRVRTAPTRADQYHAILMKAGKPLHYGMLARRVRSFGPMRARRLPAAISYILGRDRRFVAVAQSGYWALTEWSDIETRSVAKIAFDEITKARRPLSQSELYTLISAKRFLNRRSLTKLLGQTNRLMRLPSGLWTIS
jgi:hypothetical protein